MTMATNLLMILLAINLGLFVFGNPEVNSPMLAVIKSFYLAFTGSPNWSLIITTFGSSLWIYGALFLLIIAAAVATGANFITTGGGYGSIMTLQVLAIAIFSSLILMPNFAGFGFPSMLEYILDIIFGGMITVTVISMLKGN